MSAWAYTLLRWVQEVWEGSVVAAWRYVTDPVNAGTLQALSAVVVAVLTLAIASFMRKQTRTLDRQTRISEEQTRIQSMLDTLEWSPIVAAEFGLAYDGMADSIAVKNAGRGPALNIEAHLHVRTDAQQWEHVPAHAGPANLSANDQGEAHVEYDLAKEYRQQLQAPFKELGPRGNDIWVVHYRDVLGGVWHTTCNIDDQGSHGPLGYFRSWSPRHWALLPQETQGRCLTCLQHAKAP